METRIDRDSRNDLITGLRYENSSLRDTCDRYRLLLEGLQESIWEWDVEKGMYTFYTKKSGYRDLNVIEGAWDYELWNSRVHPHDQGQFRRYLDDFVKSSRKYFENTFRVRSEKLLTHSEIRTSISAGIAIHGVHGESFFDLLKCSDVALYYCKNNGKDQFRIYDSSTGEKLYTTIDLINQIRIGLERSELQMHYQPIVNSRTGRLVGIEALARWYHSKRGMISPGEFIVAAENSGQMKALERWIIDDVFRQIEAWLGMGELDMFVSVNLSARGLMEDDLISYLELMLEKHRVKPDKIEFEVTETALMNDLTQSMTMLYKLKEMGFKLSLDDFGTGYSSLNYLKNIPIDKVKLDRSFVVNIDRNTKDQLLVKSIIELSHRMELEVVGEGVETHFQNTLLGTFGCDYIQGYFHGKPQDRNGINTWIKDNNKKT